jgi:hypothetical protein
MGSQRLRELALVGLPFNPLALDMTIPPALAAAHKLEQEEAERAENSF